MSEILTKDDIKELTDLNADAIKIYLSWAEARLADILETKKQLEQKAFILFSGYITAALALFGLTEKFTGIELWLNLTAILFCIGVVPLFICFKASDYGNLGRHPKDWLKGKAYLTIKSKDMSYIFAYILYDFMTRIDTSKNSNSKKAFCLNIAVLIGMLSLTPFIIKVLFSL